MNLVTPSSSSAPRPRVVWTLLFLLSSLSCATAGGTASPTSSGAVSVGQPLPDFSFQDLRTGKPQSLSSLRGKIVLLDLWASWCAPCKEELPELDAMATRLGDGVVVLALSLDEERESALDFLRRKPSWRLNTGHDASGRVAETLQPPKMPTSYVLDRSGIVRHVNEGFQRSDAARIESWLRELSAAR